MAHFAPDELLLDPEGDAPLPATYTAVETEVAWLRETTSASTGTVPRVVVRGEALAHWAKTWWVARGGNYREMVSPARRLRTLLDCDDPGLSLALARDLMRVWGENWPEDLSVAALLSALYPQHTRIWQVVPSPDPDEAAGLIGLWLTALVTSPTSWPEAHRVVLARWVQEWEREIADAATLLPLEAADAESVLRRWVGLPAASTTKLQQQAVRMLPPFPGEIPDAWVSQARATWQADLVEKATQPAGRVAVDAAVLRWFDHASAGLSEPLARVAAEVVLTYARANQAALSQPLLRALRGAVPPEELRALEQWVPPAVPPSLPNDPEAVLQWVISHYLPYRAWQVLHGDEAAAAVSRTHALAFAAWVKGVNQQLSGTAHRYQHLYWAQPTRTQPRGSQEVVFWVIADGLGWLDARAVAQRVRALSRGRVTTTEAAPCFGLLPTITHFTKEALRSGLPYKQFLRRRAAAQEEAATDIRDSRDPVPLLAAAPRGSRIVWKPLEPDVTYHEREEASAVRRAAQSALDHLAKTIWEAVAEVPADRFVRVLLTTDHGRLLSEGRREIAVPSGFTSHGRVVYRDLQAPGPEPEPHPEIEWLSPEWFDLPDWVGVARGEHSFKIIREDGSQAGGPDNFQHGGLWPEEVVVPWFTLVRDAAPVTLKGEVTGRARPDQVGALRVRLVNTSSCGVRLRHLTLTGVAAAPVTLNADAYLEEQATHEMELTLPHWPTQQQAVAAKATVTIELPDGSEATFALSTALTSDELQTRSDDLLADL